MSCTQYNTSVHLHRFYWFIQYARQSSGNQCFSGLILTWESEYPMMHCKRACRWIWNLPVTVIRLIYHSAKMPCCHFSFLFFFFFNLTSSSYTTVHQEKVKISLIIFCWYPNINFCLGSKEDNLVTVDK